MTAEREAALPRVGVGWSGEGRPDLRRAIREARRIGGESAPWAVVVCGDESPELEREIGMTPAPGAEVRLSASERIVLVDASGAPPDSMAPLSGVNLGQARFEDCFFDSCEIAGVRASDLTIADTEFRDCRLERVDWTDPALRDVTFARGHLREVAIAEGLLLRTTIEEAALDRVTFLSTFAPETTFRGAAFHEVWAMGKGFPGSRFENVSARTCGFVGQVHFDECAFHGSKFEDTGFSGAVLSGVRVDERTRFERCDFTGAVFGRAVIAGATLVDCGLCASTWIEVDARRVRMRGAVLARSSGGALALEAETGIRLDAPRIAVRSESVHLLAGELVTSAHAVHEVSRVSTRIAELRVAEIGTDIRRAKSARDEIEGTFVPRFGAWVSDTAREARIAARTMLFG